MFHIVMPDSKLIGPMTSNELDKLTSICKQTLLPEGGIEFSLGNFQIEQCKLVDYICECNTQES